MQTYGLRAAFCAPVQHGSIADAAAGDFDRSNSQLFLVYTYLYFSPDAAFGAAVLAGIPHALPLNSCRLSVLRCKRDLLIDLEDFIKVTNGTNTKGIVLMLLSMATFAVADTLIKVAGSFLSPAQIMFFLITGGLILFSMIAVFQGETLKDPRAVTPVLLLRYCAEMTGLVGMVMALTYAPLSTVGAVTQASPIMVAVGAVLFLKETVSWRRWSSITLGFLGVVLVIQPGAESLNFAVAWAVLALVAFSVRDLVTRLTPPDISSASLATYTMVAALPFTIAWVLFNGESFVPALVNWVVVIFMVLLGSVAYLLLIASLRVGELSAVMPFRYFRIIFLLVLGVLVFDERPNVSMLIGATLIIVSGVYIMWREHTLRQRLKQEKVDD